MLHPEEYVCKREEERTEGAKLEIRMPRSVILYLGNADNVEREEVCLIRFADGTTHSYRVPVVRVQGYTPQMIEEKHLAMLIPFLPIRFRRYLGKKKKQIRWVCTGRREAADSGRKAAASEAGSGKAGKQH